MGALTENPLATMPGPAFLAFYGFVALAAVLAYAAFAVLDLGDSRPPPVPARPDPYELAYLRDGIGGVIWLAVYGLKRAGRVELGDRGQLRPLDGAPPANRYEAAALRAIGLGRTVAAVVADRDAILPLADKLDAALAARGLVRGAQERARAWRLAFAVGGALVALAGYKIAVATAHGHRNIGFLFLEALAAVVVLVVLATNTACRGANARGRAYLDRVKLAYGGSRPMAEEGSPAAGAAMLLVGIYGFGVLAGGPDAAFAQAAQRQRDGGGGDGGGGSCSSGGGDGGGGCGGCGGGGD